MFSLNLFSFRKLSSDEDCLEEEETGVVLLEDVGNGEECLESERLSSKPESLASWVFPPSSDLLSAGFGVRL